MIGYGVRLLLLMGATEDACKERFWCVEVCWAFNLCCNVLILLLTLTSCRAAGVLKAVVGVMFVLVLIIIFLSNEILAGVIGVRAGVTKERSFPPKRCRISTASLYVSLFFTWSNRLRFSVRSSANCSELEFTLRWKYHATRFLSPKILKQ